MHFQAIRRLDREEPIFWLVALHELDRQPYVRVGESSYYSGLYVDDDGTLQIVDPTITADSLDPYLRVLHPHVQRNPVHQAARIVSSRHIG